MDCAGTDKSIKNKKAVPRKEGRGEFTRFFFCVNRGYVGIGGRP